jgi:hypothetical protein
MWLVGCRKLPIRLGRWCEVEARWPPHVRAESASDHEADSRPAALSSRRPLNQVRHLLPRKLEHGQHLLPLYARKLSKEVVHRISQPNVIKQRFHWHSRAAEARGSAENLGINADRGHQAIVGQPLSAHPLARAKRSSEPCLGPVPAAGAIRLSPWEPFELAASAMISFEQRATKGQSRYLQIPAPQYRPLVFLYRPVARADGQKSRARWPLPDTRSNHHT